MHNWSYVTNWPYAMLSHVKTRAGLFCTKKLSRDLSKYALFLYLSSVGGKEVYVSEAKHNLDSVTCCCTNSSNEWNVQLKGACRRRTSARATANKEWDSSFELSLHSVGNKVLYTVDQTIQCSDTLYSCRAITTRANTMTTTVHSIVHSND
jgi:hypothetical protein